MNDPLRSNDGKDARSMQRIGLFLAVLGVLWLATAALIVMNFASFMLALNTGIDWRDAAILAFFASTTLIIVFTLVAGDGLLGELQFLIPGFFALFAFFWVGFAFIF